MTEWVITNQGNGHKKDIGTGAAIGQRIRDQPPDLTLQDQITVEAQKIIQHGAAGGHADEIHQCAAQGNIEHQIWNALVPMHKAEAFKFMSKTFQGYSTPNSCLALSYQFFLGLSIKDL